MVKKASTPVKSDVPVTPVEPSPLELLRATLKSTYKLTDLMVDALVAMGVDDLSEMRDVQFDDYIVAGVPRITARQMSIAFATVPEKAGTVDESFGKPTIQDVNNPVVARSLGFDNPMMMAAMAMGGGDPTMMFAGINVEQLLAGYDPEEPENLAGVILQKRFADQPVIAFKKGTHDVAIEATVKYIKDLRHGRPAKTQILVDGRPARLYKVGVIPNDFKPEDPMVPGTALWENVSDTYDDMNWTDIPHNVQQLVRIALKMKLFNPENPGERFHVMDLARRGFDTLAGGYQKAALRFDELQAAHKLPALTVQIGARNASVTPVEGSDDEEDSSFRRGSENRRFDSDDRF